ncbi:uncharacterized protein ACA1_031830 [Acanthamoeba castellanii str. Neff]|uniref:F-box/LRR-repeat protein 15-like leucin rich repeat domain-containing protein n=1 Tax=Acanthamoeba castellanii (strain ATCC 30010 / Neff) TaxID=1257118 RepID=L8H106_ACACF|nr:uncharacterized protein ACA1_031830 [Acanthamoeba castellanii str. Neff]ELR19159.1 hypothetical protein ACA1_031830 [Acanthamoeba castellanii str. Neff]
MWSDLPLEVKIKIFESLANDGLGYTEVCREWRDLLWQERSQLDLSLRATLSDVSNEEASLRRVLARCRRLATLILSHCPVSDDVLSAFVPFGPTLRVLILSSWYDRLSNDGLERLAATGALARLERLELGGCVRVTGQGVAHVVSHCPRLRNLNVSGVWGFGDAHMKAVVESARELTRIDVGGTAISNVGLRHLLESECAARLKFVGLAHCSHLTADSSQGGIVDLGTHCPSLIELDLSGLTQLQDKTLWFLLERCRKLEALNVAKCESLVKEKMKRKPAKSQRCQSLSQCYNSTVSN